MRRLLLAAVLLAPLGCAREPVIDGKDVQVKDTGVNVKLPNTNGEKGDRISPRSVAVLLFKTDMGAVANKVSETLDATVTKTLSSNAELEVSSQAAVRDVQHLKPIYAGEKLGVRAVLTGEIKTTNGEIVVNVELIDVTKNGKQLWGEVYRQKADEKGNFTMLEEKISKEVAEAVADKLGAKKAAK